MEGFDDFDKAELTALNMARTMKKKSSRKAKRYPVARKTILGAGFPQGDTTDIQIDAAQVLSVMNNRLYRSGRVYECKLDIPPRTAVGNSGAKMEVFALNDNWLNQEAWRLAKETWDMKYEDEELSISDKQRARWRDFRVKSGSTALVMGPNTIDDPDTTGQRTTFNVGSFPASAVIDAAGAQMEFTWGIADPTTEYSIITEMYAGGYNKETTFPAQTTGAEPYAGLTADSSDAEGSLYQTVGAEAPYGTGADTMTPFVQVASIGFDQDTAGGASKLSTGYFKAPCGIILVRYVNSAQDLNLNLSLEVKAGDYNGVHAPAMA